MSAWILSLEPEHRQNRWVTTEACNLGDHLSSVQRSSCLRLQIGQSDDVFGDMSVKAIFKGVTYELLSDVEFMRIASRKIPKLETLHDEFDAAKAEGQRGDEKETLS